MNNYWLCGNCNEIAKVVYSPGLGYVCEKCKSKIYSPESIKTVRGHLCLELKIYQQAGGGCVPNFETDGSTRGCDNINEVKIIFCPFCGIKLPEIELEGGN